VVSRANEKKKMYAIDVLAHRHGFCRILDGAEGDASLIVFLGKIAKYKRKRELVLIEIQKYISTVQSTTEQAWHDSSPFCFYLLLEVVSLH
jgi:hypothetical protein